MRANFDGMGSFFIFIYRRNIFVFLIFIKSQWLFLNYTKADSRRYFAKKVFLKISQNSQENTCGQCLLVHKVQGLTSATLFKKKLWQSCVSVIFGKFLRTRFYRTPPLAASHCSSFTYINLSFLVYSYKITDLQTFGISN